MKLKDPTTRPEDTRPGERLTPELIEKYTKLDEHSRQVLLGFCKTFPGATIEWIKNVDRNEQKEKQQ
jgi:hypothetical protein